MDDSYLLWVALPFVVGLVRGRTPQVVEDTKDTDGPFSGIRCPACRWRPEKHSRWSCSPDGCGHMWNTFDTRGVCPACDKRWHQTACIECGVWSLHEAWYEIPNDRAPRL